MLLLLGTTATHGIRAMEQQESQVKTNFYAKFLYNHPWVSSVSAHAAALGLASCCSKRFRDTIKWDIAVAKRSKAPMLLVLLAEEPTLWLPLCATVPSGAIISKRHGHQALLSSGMPHRMKKYYPICKSGCKGQHEDWLEKEAALEEISQQKKQLKRQAAKVVKNYNSKKYDF